MPNIRISNNSPQIINKSSLPSLRTTQTAVKELGAVHEVGSPIGLLLVLTYAAQTIDSNTFYGERPNIRISNI